MSPDSGSIVFFSHLQQIPEFARLASAFREHSGSRSVLLTLGVEEAALGRQSGAFDEVLDMLPDSSDLVNAKSELEFSMAYLKSLEVRIGSAFVNRDLLADRYFRGQPTPELDLADMPVHWTLAKVYRFMTYLAQRVEQVLDVWEPWLVYLETNSAPYRMAWRLAKSRGILAGSFMTARFWKDRIYFEDSLGLEWRALQRRLREPRSILPSDTSIAAGQATLAQLRRTDDQPWYMSTTFGRGGPPLINKARPARIWVHLCEWFRVREDAFRTNPRRLPSGQLSPLARLRRARAGMGAARYLDEVTRILGVEGLERFAVYLLHVQPELTVEEMAFHYQDQVATIRSLISMLPADLPLVVKEHRPMRGRRLKAFYAELAHLPGVVLCHPAVSSRTLLANGAEIVFTLTGTSAVEAVANGIPAVALGDAFLSVFPGVYHPGSLTELESRLASNAALPKPDECEVVLALAQMHALSTPSDWIPQSDLGAAPTASLVPRLMEAISAADA